MFLPLPIIIALAVTLLATLLFAEVTERRTAALVVKTPLSLLFVAVGVSLAHAGPAGTYVPALLVGLVLCLIGDVFLALTPKWAFRAGLVSFVLGHVGYVVAFLAIGQPTWLTAVGLVATGTVSTIALRWLWPHLGSMRGPVIVYIVVITSMVLAAWTVMGTATLAPRGRWMILVGALLFYVSDLFVARHRFVKKQALNRLIGLPAYYAAQFLLAFTFLELD